MDRSVLGLDDGVVIILSLKLTPSHNLHHHIHKIPRLFLIIIIIIIIIFLLPMLRKPSPDQSLQLPRIFPHPLLVPPNIHPPQIRQGIRHHKHPRQLKQTPHHLPAPPNLLPTTINSCGQPLPSHQPQHHVQCQLPNPLLHVHQNPSRPILPLFPPSEQLVNRQSRLGRAHVSLHLDLPSREELGRDEPSHLDPVGAVGGESEGGEAAAEVAGGPEDGAGGYGGIAGGEEVFGEVPAADD
ncbi:DNA binding [Striga asiatica]|uniref:DNA binding n=1 Tax=Striga asiatica TaxID=4170 RepID=A0A5A7Q5Y3_STRAF|nr:DNA binding [Striga asiatica]